MFETVLFDLDGTLVPMDMDVFVKEYFRAIGKKFAGMIDSKKLLNAIYAGTMAMIKDDDHEKSNMDVFWAYFYNHIDFPRELLDPLFTEFYQDDFAHLKAHTYPNPLAHSLIELLFSHGCRVVIATNPVFPEMAIRERLDWVGIGDFPYKLVTTYENMHFCKPRIEYYREILSRIGIEPDSCLMVGNDVEEDLVARKLGIKTFLVEDWLLNRKQKKIETDYRGSFADLVTFFDSGRITLKQTAKGVNR